MPKLSTHCTISRQRTGFNFEEIHKWIDNPPEKHLLGADHRLERHAYTNDDMKYIEEYWDRTKGQGWGKKAVIEWLFHIAIDNMHTAFKISKDFYGENTFNVILVGIAQSGFVNVDFTRATDAQIKHFFQ